MYIIYLGIPIRSNLDTSLTQQYAALIKSLSDKARSAIREIDPTNELVFFRMRTRKHEILVAPGLLQRKKKSFYKLIYLFFFLEKEYTMIVLQGTDTS